MRLDPGSNYTFGESHASKSYSAAAATGVKVDHADGDCVSFFISVGTVGSSATVDAKVQYSDDDSTWTDEPDTTAGNDTAITQITTAGTAQLDVPNPRARYSRCVVTVGTAACVLGVTSVLGPKRIVVV